MDRMTVSQTKAEEMHDYCAGLYPGYEQPCPGTALKLYDDVMWLEVFPIRVVHGHDHPDYFNGYSPELTGEESTCNVDAHYITDRAPLDPNETPMPIYPAQPQARAAAATAGAADKPHKRDEKQALQHVLKQLKPEQAKKARALVKAKRPELLSKDG